MGIREEALDKQRSVIVSKKKKKKISISLITSSLVLAGTLIFLACYFIEGIRSGLEYKKLSEIQSSLAELTTITTVGTTAPDAPIRKPILPLAEELLKQNPDTVGWITIQNTNINYPVVRRGNKEEENSYYLTHSFDGSQNRKGAVMMDYRTTASDIENSDNIVLYAHNEKDNSMFGDLDNYKNNGSNAWSDKALEFYKQNPVITFSTNYEKADYKIFAVFVTMTTDKYDSVPLFDYQNYIDFDMNRYMDFIDNIEKRNKLITDVNYKFGDEFLTLSTCSNEANDARLVIVARKVREGEGSFVDTTNATFEKNPVYEHNWTEIYKNY